MVAHHSHVLLIDVSDEDSFKDLSDDSKRIQCAHKPFAACCSALRVEARPNYLMLLAVVYPSDVMRSDVAGDVG